MSARNTLRNKKLRSLTRSLRKGRVPAYIDLVHWLRLRGYADTAGQARQIIMDGRVKSESHTLGTRVTLDKDNRKIRVFEQFVPARLRESLRVEPQDA